jgi:hypothetical protein
LTGTSGGARDGGSTSPRSRVDKLIAAAKECRADPVRHMLAIRPTIMSAALIDAAEDAAEAVRALLAVPLPVEG